MSLSFSQFLEQGGAEPEESITLPKTTGKKAIFERAVSTGNPFQAHAGDTSLAAPQQGAFTGYERQYSMPSDPRPYGIPDPIYRENIGSYGFKLAGKS